ncbi:hypothetical protein EJ05DRAFT_485955 [Pseudovirgaria hyperparasitica]|uniref:Uncharacterized protein n=1 Tax=Pseudovirgaria hyperparasitica TaxID=470096 RepID=A0A6A6W9U8_9PEZI|nr:uncharacterized protein EJ05DRAFT_485955 [Pseudovirgaria hyperparasitica]KAF2757871.1 hypothetical protein EJ05DRAFT_485955 [Pseudovirgaria hyperparasitica]
MGCAGPVLCVVAEAAGEGADGDGWMPFNIRPAVKVVLFVLLQTPSTLSLYNEQSDRFDNSASLCVLAGQMADGRWLLANERASRKQMADCGEGTGTNHHVLRLASRLRCILYDVVVAVVFVVLVLSSIDIRSYADSLHQMKACPENKGQDNRISNGQANTGSKTEEAQLVETYDASPVQNEVVECKFSLDSTTTTAATTTTTTTMATTTTYTPLITEGTTGSFGVNRRLWLGRMRGFTSRDRLHFLGLPRLLHVLFMQARRNSMPFCGAFCQGCRKEWL